MKPRTLLFIIGLLVTIWGLFPLLAGIKFLQATLKGLPTAGTFIYQLILILLGIIAIGYSIKRKPVVMPRE
jgi:hypothetical protein